MRTSTPFISATAAATLSSEVTSMSCTEIETPSFSAKSRSSCAFGAFRPSIARIVAYTWCPFFARVLAASRPKPLLHPVMRTLFDMCAPGWADLSDRVKGRANLERTECPRESASGALGLDDLPDVHGRQAQPHRDGSEQPGGGGRRATHDEQQGDQNGECHESPDQSDHLACARCAGERGVDG